MEGGPPCFAPDFTCPALLGCRLARGTGGRVRGLHPAPPAFPCRSATSSLCDRAAGIRALRRAAPQPPCSNAPALHACTGLGWSAFARRYSRNLGCFLFLRVLTCFSSPGCRLPPYVFGRGRLGMTPGGFPHSGIPGSKAVCASPGLIAACRALRRLPMPRHPPCALGIFIPGPLSGARLCLSFGSQGSSSLPSSS